ncbi:HNH endonuclease [Lysobacter sp. HA35]
MAKLERHLSGGSAIAGLLLDAGMKPDAVRHDRAFSSDWGFDDGRVICATVWMDDIQDPNGVPKWSQTDPALRTDLTGTRLRRANDLYQMLRRRDGGVVRVILQRKRADKRKWKSGIADRRGLDPEPWFVAVEGSSVLLQRGQPIGRREVSVTGASMLPSRPPSTATRETRPEQSGFRQRVAAKTGNRCALTGAPSEVCDAAHFHWTDWRTDNAAWHGALLRRDLHAALDAGLISIDRSGAVVVSEYLASSSVEYAQLHGRTVAIGEPEEVAD